MLGKLFKRDPNKMLLDAAYTGDHTKVLKALNAGAKLNVKDKDGMMPIHHAAARGHSKTANALAKAGAKLHVEDKQGYTPSDLAMERGDHKMVDLLAKAGAPMPIQTPSGQSTWLHNAIQHGHHGMVRYLLNQGVNPDIRNHLGKSPMDYVTNRDNLHALAAAGANPFTAGGRRSYVPHIREHTTLLRLPEHVPYGKNRAASDLDKENAIMYEPINGSKFYIKPRRHNMKNVKRVYSRNTIKKLLNTTAKDPYTQHHFYAKNVYALRE